jgi:uncharacterized protein (DUF302 family)
MMENESKVTERGFAGVRVEVATTASFDTVLSRLRDLTGQTSLSGVVDLAKTDITEAQYVKEVERNFVGSSGFMLFSVIDHGAWIAKFGIKRRTIRWILGNPLIAITMIRHDLTAGLFAPVELLLTECAGGEGCVVTYVRPSSLISIDDAIPDLKEAALKLDAKFEILVLNATMI